MKKLVAIDLFSGAGGTTAGLKKAGVDVRAAVEINSIAAKTYLLNNPEVTIFEKDIKEIKAEELARELGKLDNQSLILVACPPCQGFSSIGTHNKYDIRNQLIFEYERLIQELNPEFLLMENVAGMSRGIGKEIFKQFRESISEKYEIVYDILNAADYGVPQTRKRLVVHGIRKDILSKVNQKTNFKISLPIQTHSEEGKTKALWVNSEVILDLPPIKAGEEYKGDGVYNHISNNLSDINIRRIQHIRKHGGDRTSLPDHLVLECHKRSSGHKDVYGVLDSSKPAITITGGCMSYSKGRFGHPTQDRALSAREAARLQSFDDEYIFIGNKTQLATQIGNAVPVKLAEASGKYFIKLAEILGDEI